jgi:hypothetical protein
MHMRASNASKDDEDLRNEGRPGAMEPKVGSSTASNTTGGDPGIKPTNSGNLAAIVSAVPPIEKRPSLVSGAKAKQAAPKPAAKAPTAAKPKPAKEPKKPAARPKPVKGAKAPAAAAKGGRRA